MINFRYHLISLVAVFLALGIGIVMGTTVMDKAIVDGLQNRIEKAEQNSIDRKVENGDLRETLDSQDRQVTALSGTLVQNRLANNTVFILTVGSVSNDVKVETQELLGVANARLAGVVQLNDNFIQSNKGKFVTKLNAIPNVQAHLANVTDPDKATISILSEMLSVQAGGQNDLQIDTNLVEQLFNDSKAFNITEKPNSFEPAYPVTFIVLVQRTALADKAVQRFVSQFPSRFPTTIGLVGENDDDPSRAKAIEMIGNNVSQMSVVDNVESPSGRATLVLAHTQTIQGSKAIYGVSKSATSAAPELTP